MCVKYSFIFGHSAEYLPLAYTQATYLIQCVVDSSHLSGLCDVTSCDSMLIIGNFDATYDVNLCG